MALHTTLLLFFLLGTVFVLNFNQTTASVQQRLYEDAKNTASSLSLTLGTAGGDLSAMATMINADFDSGHYMKIALSDMKNALLFERTLEPGDHDVPAWFTAWVDIAVPTASAQVSAGWSPVGILKVQSDSSYAYTLLYESLKGLLTLFLILLIIGLCALYIILHLLLRPLKQVQLQAEAVMRNEFIIQEELPHTTEFADVVNGMNLMVDKVQQIFQKGNEAMQRNRELLYTDPRTNLYNRRYFMMKFPEYLGDDTPYDMGVLILIALHGVREANIQLGYREVDRLYDSMGSLIQRRGEGFKHRIAARLNSTEIGMLLPGCDEDEGMEIARNIGREVKDKVEAYGLDTKTFGITMGVYRYDRSQNAGEILSRADYALAQANLMPLESAYLYRTHEIDAIMGKEAWRDIIVDAIARKRFNLEFRPVFDTRSKTLHHKVLSFTLGDSDGNRYTYGMFIAPVINLGLEPTVYMHVLERLLLTEGFDENGGKCSVRLPSEFLDTPHVCNDLDMLFEAHAAPMREKLVFELPESLIIHDHELMHALVSLFRRYGFEYGIFQFTGESKDYRYLQKHKPAYIKSDTAFLLDHADNSIPAIQMMTHSLNIELIASGVQNTEEFDKLESYGIHTVQGALAEAFFR